MSALQNTKLNFQEWRMLTGKTRIDFAQLSGLSDRTLYKMERFEPVSRLTAQRALNTLNELLSRSLTFEDIDGLNIH